MKCRLRSILGLWIATTVGLNCGTADSDISEISWAYHTYAQNTHGTLDASIQILEMSTVEELANRPALDVVHMHDGFVKSKRQWNYVDDCVNLTIEPEWMNAEYQQIGAMQQLTFAEMLHYGHLEGLYPNPSEIQEVTVYQVALKSENFAKNYQSAALHTSEGWVLVDYVLRGIDGFYHRIRNEKLCEVKQLDQQQSSMLAGYCPTRNSYYYFSDSRSLTSSPKHACGGTCKAKVTFRFNTRCSSSCLLTNNAAFSYTSCQADDGCWNSWDCTDVDTATHNCSDANGNSCEASAAFHCVTNHSWHPFCGAQARVLWQGSGFVFGPGSGDLNATLAHHHRSYSCF